MTQKTDKECIDEFTDMLDNRVSITTAFLEDRRTGNLTHQILQIQCGEEQVVSNPQELANPLRLATAEELGETVN